MKKLVFIFIFLLILPIGVYAAVGSAQITLTLSRNSTHDTSVYNFQGSAHHVTIDINQLTNQNDTHKTVIALYKKKLFGSTREARKTINIDSPYSYCVDMGTTTSGKHYYGFGSYQNAYTDNSSHGTIYTGYVSNSVFMYTSNFS